MESEVSKVDAEGIKESIISNATPEESKEALLKEIVTYDTLNKFAYGKELQAELERLGVGEVYQGGKKKELIINNALSAFAELRKSVEAELANKESKEESKEQDLKKESVGDALEKLAKTSPSAKEHKVLQAVKSGVQLQADKEQAEIDRLVEKGFKKDELINHIQIVDLNIQNGNPHFLNELQVKRRILVKVYEILFKEDYDTEE